MGFLKPAAIEHAAGTARIYALQEKLVEDSPELPVVSTRPPNLGSTLKASASRDRLFLEGGVAGAEYEIWTPHGPIPVRVVHQERKGTGQAVAGAVPTQYLSVPPVGVTIGGPSLPWRKGMHVEQAPGARRPRGFDYTAAALELGPGVKLTESTWRKADGFGVDDLSHDEYLTRAWFYGGQDDGDYDVTNLVRFSDGTKDERTVQVRVRRQ